MVSSKEELAKMIDYSLLKPEATREEVKKFCETAKKYNFNAVFVNPTYVPYSVRILKGSGVKVGAPVGFPFGATTQDVKIFETTELINCGANEIDMVINIGALKSKNYLLVEEEIRGVVGAAKGLITKVILETGYLTEEEIIKGCQIAKDSGANFVKTATGFGPAGATEEVVRLMRQVVGKNIGVKASGGIKTFTQAIKLIEAGANRIGTSSGVEIILEFKK